MSKPILTLASGNEHKRREIEAVLGIPLRSLREVESPPELVEDGNSFTANALIKARGLSAHIGDWTLADDSGLEVDALDGEPGIHSARFAGCHGDAAANNALLLKRLEGESDRTARFVCVLALCGPDDEEWVVRGACQGVIAESSSGGGGFGYDPLFIPAGFDRNFAELGEEVKNRISHRAAALRNLLEAPGDPLGRFR